jgi:peptidoglycan/xylan/chitin deacetylase (PgdA/CDA1 family)
MLPKPPQPGRLDHDLYDPRIASRLSYSQWPGDRAAAAFVLIHLEAFELQAPVNTVRDPGLRGDFGSFFPDLRAHSLIEYGNRIGVFRLLDLLQPLGWQVAIAVNGLVADERPALIRSLASRGIEILASSWSASRMITSALSIDEERDLLRRSVGATAHALGAPPTGYASQDYGYSWQTPALLEELGFDYAVDWPNDELPYLFGPTRRLLMLPPAAELDDAQAMLARKLRPREWGNALLAALSWWTENAFSGSVFVLPLHAWVAGAAHRVPPLRRALEAHSAMRFWQARPSDVVASWRAKAQSEVGDASEVGRTPAPAVSDQRPLAK